MVNRNEYEKKICSLCGLTELEVGPLLRGTDGAVCQGCLELYYEALRRAEAEATTAELGDAIATPVEVHRALDEYVIGQTRAKKAIAVSVYNHYKRILSGIDFDGSDDADDVELEKSNILLVGPTGSGKTLLARTLARFLQVPFAIADATTLTEAGYVGEDVENVLLRLIQSADGDIERAERGIIYIDEIDKIGRKSENTSITRDVSGEGVQQALLKIVEGTLANVPPQGGRKHPHQQYLTIDTSNILFICGGHFEGLDEIVARRVGKGTVGFGATIISQSSKDRKTLLTDIEPRDLLEYGLIPELIGRIPIVVTLNELDIDDLIRILLEPKNALVKQYKKQLFLEDVTIEFTDDALRAVAEKATKRGSGARGLRAVMETIMLDIMYYIPGRDDVSKVIVGEEVIAGIKEPEYVMGSKRQMRQAG